MGKIGEYKYSVQPRDVDFRKQMTLTALGDCILNVAGENADDNGFGMKVLSSRGYAWVLSRMAVEMNNIPMQYDDITVQTWVEEVSKIMTTRDFIILDAAGNTIGGACTQWVMIDFESRRPVDLATVLDYSNSTVEKNCSIEKPKRVHNIIGEIVVNHHVRYSDIDFNHHLNSMKYVQIIVDTFPLDLFQNKIIKRLDINYIHETLYDDNVSVVRCVSGDDCYDFEFFDSTQKPICRAEIQWQ